MTKQVNDKTRNAEQLQAELDHFCGDLVRYRHPLNRKVIYTPGVRHLANEASAHWLVDAIASWISSIEFKKAAADDPCINYMHFWKLTVNSDDNTATLHAEADCDVEPFIVHKIDFTDFPLDEISIWAGFDGSHWILYLPSEH